MELQLPPSFSTGDLLLPLKAGTLPQRRKQYQSCDACRKNRRGCDAVRRGVDPLHPEPDSVGFACSLCLKSGRRCTFDWLRGLPDDALPRGLKRKREYLPDVNAGGTHFTSGQDEEQTRHGCYPPEFQDTPLLPWAEVAAASQHISQQPWDWEALWKEPSCADSALDQPSFSLFPTSTFEVDVPVFGASQSSRNGHDVSLSDHAGPNSTDNGISVFTLDSTSTPSDALLLHQSELSVPQPKKPFPMAMTYPPEYAFCDSHVGPFPLRRGEAAVNSTASAPPLPSPMLGDALTQSSNRHLISADLVQIYHGSLENALRCWLTEQHCPYRRLNRTRLASQHSSTSHSPTYLQRIYHLDRVSQHFQSGKLSAEDSNLASKTVNLVIMSFASQWTHASHASSGDSLAIQQTGTTGLDDFECLLRQSLWHEAQRYIRACARVNCFRTIFAQMVFSLVQKPVESLHESAALARTSSPLPTDETALPSSESRTCVGMTWPCSESLSLLKVAASDNIERSQYLEQGLRRLLAWRHRLIEWSSDGTGGGGILYADQMASRRAALGIRAAFDVVFWLGLMCDTTSSVLNNRPLIISDHESCALNGQRSNTLTTPIDEAGCNPAASRVLATEDIRSGYPDPRAVNIWDLALMRQTHGVPASRTTEAILQEAIPSKVLLWRKLGALKSTLTHPVGPAVVEQHIESALEVANFWKVKYGPVIQQCIESHDKLGFKIQSWYVILAAHFHLACLFITDCIDQIDRGHRACAEKRLMRMVSAVTLEMTKDSAYTIADLAKACVPSHSTDRKCSLPDTDSDVHHTIRATALLSEPWTDVLTEALSKAFETMFDWLTFWHSQVHLSDGACELSWLMASIDGQDLAIRCSACIDALELLGRKSHNAARLSRQMRSQLSALVELPWPY